MKKILLCLIVVFTSTVAHGQATFQKTFETTSGDGGSVIKQTQDKGYILLSSQYGYSYIVKTDSLGNKTWSKKIDYGIWYVTSSGISQTNDGGYILSGSAGGSINSFLMKLGPTGNIVWQKAYCYFTDISYVKDDIDGTGYIAEGTGYGLVLMKIDFSGNLIWNVAMHPSAGSQVPHSRGFIQLQSDSSFITLSITGNGVVDAVLCAKFSKTGNNIWVKSVSINGTTQRITGIYR